MLGLFLKDAKRMSVGGKSSGGTVKIVRGTSGNEKQKKKGKEIGEKPNKDVMAIRRAIK